MEILSLTKRFFLIDDEKIIDALLALKWDTDTKKEILRVLRKGKEDRETKIKQKEMQRKEEEKNKEEERKKKEEEELEQKKAILLDFETGTFDYAIESLYNSVKKEEVKEKVEDSEAKLEDIEELIHAPKNRSMEELPKANIYKRDIEVAREAQTLYEYNKKEDIELVV
ncbi:hypothetical protein C2G38_2162752 [Gigaspora rosea]|uniref:Uncharacterized protein n=1 Tax=Gigaspora rosea TaxID=44941 RepID=A0A397VY30_9GLOM|nr:hypothetical protein C2G38_2162752 [Gigaspora rosea]